MVLYKSDDPSADTTTSDISLGSQHLQARALSMLSAMLRFGTAPVRIGACSSDQPFRRLLMCEPS